MMERAIVSVIVPVFNAEDHLFRCVNNILAQTFTDFELLLVDDGSTDVSGAICDEYARKDPRVRVFHKENGGVSSARNLGLDKDTIRERACQALKDVGLSEEFYELSPFELSGGQKQRLMIARAIAPKPRVLMFDEATSALDNITQKKVSESLDSLKCTRIVVAHRLSTIRQCDRIIVLDGGRIIEDGTYDELINKGGFFAELVERQRVDV